MAGWVWVTNRYVCGLYRNGFWTGLYKVAGPGFFLYLCGFGWG